MATYSQKIDLLLGAHLDQQDAKKLATGINKALNEGARINEATLNQIVNDTNNAFIRQGKSIKLENFIDTSGILSAASHTDALRLFAEAVQSAVAEGIEKGVASGLLKNTKNSFLKNRAAIEKAYEQNKTEKGELSRRNKTVTSINEALQYSPSDTAVGSAKRLGNLAEAWETAKDADWESQYAILKKYVAEYRQLKELSTTSPALKKYESFGGFTFNELASAEQEITASLSNIINRAKNLPLIGIDVELTPIKPIDVNAATGGKGKVEVPVEFNYKKAPKGTTPDAFFDVTGDGHWSGEQIGKTKNTASARMNPLNEVQIEAKNLTDDSLIKYLLPNFKQGLQTYRDSFADDGNIDELNRSINYLNERLKQIGVDLLTITNYQTDDYDLITRKNPLQNRIIEYTGKLPDGHQPPSISAEEERITLSQQLGTVTQYFNNLIAELSQKLAEARATELSNSDLNNVHGVTRENARTIVNDLDGKNGVLARITAMRDAAIANITTALEPLGGAIASEVQNRLKFRKNSQSLLTETETQMK